MEIDFIEPGYYYHIYNRGINRQVIFEEEEHYFKFLNLCKKYLIEKSDVLAYCLLPNHFHLLLYIKEYPDRVPGPCQGKESLFLSHLFNAYAQYFNKKTNRTGGLFQRPFRRKRITNEAYLKQVVYYIHRNPLHHELVLNPRNWLYNSYSAYLSNQQSMISRKEVFEWFGGKRNFVDYHQMQFEIDKSIMLDE